jgi:hypothetical protein
VYRAVADDSGGVYYEYEPSPQPGQELYRVWFSQTSPAEGDYVRQTDTIQGRGVYYYRHVGQGNGSYTARATVPAPERKVTGEFVARYNPTEWASLDVDVAGEDHDRNLFSSIDDADNRAAASRTRFRLGRKRLDSASAWVSGTHQYVSRGFSREILPAWEARRQWDRENELFPGAQRNLWDLTLGGTIIPGLSTAINYGQFIQEHQLITDRVSNTTGYTLSDALHLEYTGDYLRHLTAQGAGRLRRGDATARLELDRAVLRLSFDDEWKHIDTDEQIRGSMGAGVNLELPSLHLTEEVYYARRFRDKRSLARSLYRHRRLPADTGAVFYWTQKITRSPRESWQLSASSSWQYQRELQDTITALLISAASDLTSPRTGIATRHELRVSSERTSMYVQVPVYAGGAGLGDYSLDSVTQEYYYNPRRGDTYIYEREVYDTTGSNRTRKAFFGWDWRFEPPPGVFEGVLLGDITWNGALSLEEHVVNRPDEPARYWLPGFLTLNRTSKDDSLVSLADISYRQEAEWSRDSIEGLSVELFTQPAIRKVRGYTEREMSLGIEADYEIGDWRLGFDARQLRLRHRPSSHGYSEGFSFVDRHAVLSQQWRLPLSLRLFCEETGGYARRWFTGSSGEDGDGYYALLRPGIAFEPMDKGHAEASYSFARVNIPGMLDYRMARGYESGTSHRIELSANIDAGERFTITGLYFGELSRGLDEDDYGRALHTVSMEVKAQL